MPEEIAKWICSKETAAWPFISEPSTYEPYRPYLWAQGTAISSVKLCNLRAAIADRTLTSPIEIIRQAVEIDEELNESLDKMSRVWNYEKVQLDETTPDSLEVFVHIHQDLSKALLWNNTYCIRVILHDIILHFCKQLNLTDLSLTESHEVLQQYQRSLFIINHTSSNICASVPYIVGTVPEHLHHKQRALKVTDGLGLLWVLFVVSDSPFVENRKREWAIGRLHYINHMLGIRQAGLMADTLYAEAPDVKLETLAPMSSLRLFNGVTLW